MEHCVVYLKCDRNVEVQSPKVRLSDMGSFRCREEDVAQKLEQLEIWHFREGEARRCVISVLRIIRLLEEACPGIVVESVGEPDVLVEWVNVDRHKGWQIRLKIVMVCLVSFFGTAYAIMAYHNDVGINDVFAQIYRMVMDREPGQVNTLQVSYSIGLSLGIIIFFNHVGGRRITQDPTPIEAALRGYEEEVDKTLIATAGREGLEKEQ